MIEYKRIVFNCDECDTVFPKKSFFISTEIIIKKNVEIVPDVAVMTLKTADLRIIFESI